MQLGMIGLGRMGANMVRRLSRAAISAWSSIARRSGGRLVKEKAVGASSLADFVKKLAKAASHLADGPRGRGGQHHRRSPAPA